MQPVIRRSLSPHSGLRLLRIGRVVLPANLQLLQTSENLMVQLHHPWPTIEACLVKIG